MQTAQNVKRIGRPPLPPEELRAKSLRVKMTNAEHAAIMELARRLNRPAGEIMRNDALNRAAAAGISITAASEERTE